MGDGIAFPLGQSGHRSGFGQVLADQAIRVLGGSPLPGVIGRGKVELHPRQALDAFVAMELRAVVRRDRPDLEAADQHHQRGVDFRRRLVLQLADEHEAGLAIHQGQDAVPGSRAVDQVHLEMPLAQSPGGGCGAFAEAPLASQNAPAVCMPIPFPPPLPALAQVPVQVAPVPLVPPYIPVDGLVADLHHLMQAQHQGYLFRRPILLQEPADHIPLPGGELRLLAATAAPAAGVLLGDPVDVAAVAVDVAADLPADGRTVPVQQPADLRRIKSLPKVVVDEVSFVSGDLLMAHVAPSTLDGGWSCGGRGRIAPFFTVQCVAFTM